MGDRTPAHHKWSWVDPSTQPCAAPWSTPSEPPSGPLLQGVGHHDNMSEAQTFGLSPPDVSACCSEAAFAANSAAS